MWSPNLYKVSEMDAITLTLLGYPISIFANSTYDQLKKIAQKIDVNPLKDLFIKSFFTSLEYHDKYYDEYSKKVIDELRKAVKKDEDKLLSIFSKSSDNFDNLLSLIRNRSFQEKIAEEITDEYSLDSAKDRELIKSIVTDCLSYYLSAFFNQMNEKEGIQAILIECLKLNTITDLLKQIDSQIVTKKDFGELRRIVLLNYFNENKELWKTIEDYDQYLRNKFKYVELRGFSPKISGKEVQMELLDIFVPLEIKVDKIIVPNIEQQIPLLQHFNETNIREVKEDRKKDPLTSILEYRHLVILGDPGAGKSTLIKFLALEVIRLRKSKNLFANTIPLYLKISSYADYFKKNKKTLYEYITEHYDKQYKHIFREGFEFSNLLLLMDGLDEITDTPLRIKVTEQVMDLIARYPYNQYVVTSRIVGYQESKLGGDFNHFKLIPFGLAEIKLFSKHWYDCIAQHTDNDYKHAEEQANSLYHSISRNPSVIRLATNPLLMTIIAMIHYKGKKLPNKRVELYEISTETFLEYWVQLRMDDESRLKDKNELIEILAPLAFEIHKNKSNGLIEEKEFEQSFLLNFKNIHTNTPDETAKRECTEFINFLQQEAGFFYLKGIDDENHSFYGFIHQTFEEYLAAIELVTKWNEGDLDLKNYIFNARWVEVIRLAASLGSSYKGRSGRKLSTQFVKDIIAVEDTFPEGYRPLQLVCLILSDDVNITDEFLNEILDKIFEIVANKDFEELTESFSKLFKELLYSDYRDAFFERCKKEVITSESTLFINLIRILVFNSWDREINKLLLSFIEKNEERIFKVIYQINWENFPIQNTKVYKENFKNYLYYMKSQNDKEGLIIAIKNFIQMETKGDSFNIGMEKWIYVIDQFLNTELFDIFLNYCFDKLLYRYLPWKNCSFSEINIVLSKYSENVLAKNLIKSLNDIKYVTPNYSRSTIQMFRIENYTATVISYDDKKIDIIFWSQSYDELFSYSTSVKDIIIFLKELKSRFSESDIEIIENEIYGILPPNKDADIENITRYIKAVETGNIKFRLDQLPLFNVNLNYSILSKIIIQHGRYYIETGILGSYITEESFDFRTALKYLDNEDTYPPAKLLAYYIMKKPIDQELLDKSIVYFRECSPEERKGAFSILYIILNPFKLA